MVYGRFPPEDVNTLTDEQWQLFLTSVKVSLYGYPEADTEYRSMYDAKFDENGNTHEQWSAQQWTEDYWNSFPRFSTQGCNSVTRPHRTNR